MGHHDRGPAHGAAIDATPTSSSEYRHFWVAGGATLTLTDLTLLEGSHRGGGSSVFVDVGAALDATRVSFVSNGQPGNFYGGAIWNAGHTTIRDSIFTNNWAYRGGAIANGWGLETDIALTVTRSTFNSNQAKDQGGAIWNAAALGVSNSTFSGNAADIGGAIVDSGTASIENATISGNESRKLSGAVAISDELTLSNSLVMGNDGGDVLGLTDQVASIIGIRRGWRWRTSSIRPVSRQTAVSRSEPSR